MYIIIKLLSYYYYFIIIFFPHERRGLHDPILVQINSISSSSSCIRYIEICNRFVYNNKYNIQHDMYKINLIASSIGSRYLPTIYISIIKFICRIY